MGYASSLALKTQRYVDLDMRLAQAALQLADALARFFVNRSEEDGLQASVVICDA
jgi:hypothetical protein